MNAEVVRCGAIRETELTGLHDSGQPRGWRGAGVLHRRSTPRMLESFLRFAIVIETKLVHCGVADGPRMAEVPLLESLVGNGSKTGHVRAGSLELRKR